MWILQALRDGDFLSLIMGLAVYALIIFVILPVHEYAHAWAASKLGDRTALQRGRLSFDPMRHLDPMGALCLVLFGFGWAKPVPVNPWYFKNRKTGMALTALAGPVSNLLMAFLGALLYNVLAMVLPVGNYWLAVYYFFYYYISINISLTVFNLLPIPPLDGSKVAAVLLPDRLYVRLMRYERYGMILLLLLSWLGWTGGLVDNAIMGVYNALFNLFY
jgi:Zn-dependent protease